MSKRFWIVLIIVIVVLGMFFYPKECGSWGTSIEIEYQECNCLGLKLTESTPGGSPYACFGLCLDCKCVRYSFDNTKGLVPCKTGIECSSTPRHTPNVPLGIIKENTPSHLSEIANQGTVTSCIDYDIITSEPRVVCLACGWECALDSPYFWRFSFGEQELDAHIWDIQCSGTGFEYRLKGEESKEGYKVMVAI